MSTFTENYSLIKPDEADYYDVADFNENMDAIDTLMAETEQEMTAISEKIGTPTEEGQTIFSLLANNSSEGVSVVKSLQHFIYSVPEDTTSGSISISSVDPAKCLVLFERLYNATSSNIGVKYTLSETKLSLTHSSTANSNSYFGFWIVEFY